MRPLATPQGARPRKKLQATVLDFTEGMSLDLIGMDPEPKGVNSLINMDPLPRGGAMKRRVVKPFQTDQLASAPGWVGTYTSVSDTTWVVMCFEDGSIRATYQEGGLSAEIQGATPGGLRRGVVVNGVLVLQNGTGPALQWDGTNRVYLGTAFSPIQTPINPIQAGIPIAKYGYVWRGRLWVMVTREDNFVKRNRIRSSYQMFNSTGYRDFDPDEYLDLDIGKDSEGITGGAINGDNFYIFKDHHVYKVDGSDWSESANLFSFKAITSEAGACSDKAIASVGPVTYFWDARKGAHAILDVPNTYGRFQYAESIMGGMERLIDEKLIPEERASEVTVSACMDKVIFGVPWRTGANRCLVYHTLMKCWSIYELDLGQVVDYRPRGLPAAVVGVHRGPTRLVSLENSGDMDNFGDGLVGGFHSEIRLSWMHMGYPAQPKFWRWVQIQAQGTGEYEVTALKDWDEQLGYGAEKASIASDPACSPIALTGRLRTAEALAGANKLHLGLCVSKSLSVLVKPPLVGPWTLRSVTVEAELDGRTC